MANQVAFENTPADVLVPIFMAELNAGPPSYSSLSRQIVIGRAKTGSAAALAAKPINVGGTSPNVIAGAGSIGADMLLYARQRNPLGEIWFLDAGAPDGVPAAALGALTVTGLATAPGVLSRYIAGERYDVTVAIGDTPAIVAAALVAEIGRGYTRFNQTMSAPVTASIDAGNTGKVVLTANHVGAEGNWISIETGLDGDEVEVAGLTVTATAMANGTGDVDMAAVLAKLGSEPYDFITSPYALTAQLNAARDFLADSGSGRWAPLVGLQGHYISAVEGNLATLTVFGRGRNDQHATLLGLNKMPHPRWSYVAALGGEIAFRKNLGRSLKEAIEIARPMRGLVLSGLRGPKNPDDAFDAPDRDSLLRNGISTYTVRADGQIACDKIITTYRSNAAGLPDRGFLNIEKVMIGAYMIRLFRNGILGAYGRHAMAETNPNDIQGLVTPAQYRAKLVHIYTQAAGAGIVRQVDLFSRSLIVDFDYANDRANTYLPAVPAAQLNVFANNVTLHADLAETGVS